MRLLVTDLDNTLYDWVTAFARSFRAMLRELGAQLGVSEDTLCQEFRAVHRRHHNSEHPYAILEIGSVRRAFPGATAAELLVELARPLAAFDAARATWLRLYDGVDETLSALRDQGVVVVGHTEAIGVSARQRLRMLGIEHHFAGVYCLESTLDPHPSPTWQDKGGVALHVVPREERKPNPALLQDICASECARIDQAVYVGDSRHRDVWMARRAGVCAVWARYGKGYTPEDWDMVVRVSHWTEEDLRRERTLKANAVGVRPDYAIDRYGELLGIVPAVTARPRVRVVRRGAAAKGA